MGIGFLRLAGNGEHYAENTQARLIQVRIDRNGHAYHGRPLEYQGIIRRYQDSLGSRFK